MILDERQLQNGVSVSLLAKLIEKHESRNGRYEKLKRYYLGRHDILNRRRMSDGVANNKIVCNHAKYITDMAQSYLVGNAVTYSPSEGYDIEPLKNAYLEQDIANLDSELVKNMSIYGRAYELIYADEDSNPRSAYIPPQQAFVIYNDDCTHFPIMGVYYYKTYDVDGCVTGVVCNVYDSDCAYTYEANSDNWNSMVLTAQIPHYFGKVPLIEYNNNADKQGDYEQIIPLIDAYNILMSDRVNDKEQFVDAFLFLTGIDIDSEQAQKLKRERILMGYEGAKAEYLSKALSESDIKVLRDNLKEDIHRFSLVPDLSDESFGNNLSGVAIKYKLLGFEQSVKNKERYFSKSLKKRFEIYNNFLSVKGQMQEVPIHRVDIVFTRNLPVNNLEVAQMINNLSNMVTSETLLDQLDFVADPKEEAELVRKEQAEKQEQTVNSLYSRPIKTNEQEE
jgi:SPP1 family phage portal protein